MMLKAATRSILSQHRSDITDLFGDILAARLGRTATEIRETGLAASDFKSDESIELDLCDGSKMSFRHAFVVLDLEQRIIGVFTEHCGYFCYPMADLQVDELRDGSVVQRHAW